ncbi:MAG TPA: hypothetical protein VF476_07430, partial [Chitinophagaceae bacterium]
RKNLNFIVSSLFSGLKSNDFFGLILNLSPEAVHHPIAIVIEIAKRFCGFYGRKKRQFFGVFPLVLFEMRYDIYDD